MKLLFLAAALILTPTANAAEICQVPSGPIFNSQTGKPENMRLLSNWREYGKCFGSVDGAISQKILFDQEDNSVINISSGVTLKMATQKIPVQWLSIKFDSYTAAAAFKHKLETEKVSLGFHDTHSLFLNAQDVLVISMGEK